MLFMNAIITGASGFIGRAMSDRFAQAGYNVTGWDIADAPDRTIKRVDLCDPGEIDRALCDVRPDIVIHCAGSANVSASMSDPDRDMLLSVGITHNLLFALLRAGLDNVRLIYLSSAGVYGNPASLPIAESAARRPVSPYALHKCMCEDICRYFIDNHGMDIRIARIFSAYGSGLKKQIFWDMYKKYSGSGRLDMFGTGNESRDFINIEDLKEAIYLMAVRDYDHRIINVANGVEVTIRNVVESFADSMGIDRSVIAFNGLSRPGDPNNWKADISRLKELGYEQRISIEEGIGSYCRWIGSADNTNG